MLMIMHVLMLMFLFMVMLKRQAATGHKQYRKNRHRRQASDYSGTRSMRTPVGRSGHGAGLLFRLHWHQQQTGTAEEPLSLTLSFATRKRPPFWTAKPAGPLGVDAYTALIARSGDKTKKTYN